MSVINTNQAPLALNATGLSAEAERSSAGFASLAPRFQQRSDAISATPWMPPNAASGDGFGHPYSTGSGGASGFGGIISGFMSAISDLIAQLTAMVNGANGSAQPGGSGSALPSGGGSPASPQQTHFANASAGSVGDPHESFSGTTAGGSKTAEKWDDMRSHDNLLSSDSFEGGYRVSTSTTQPNAKGVTLNDRASVTTDGGRTSVRMEKDGSYDVRTFGHDVALTAGQAVHLSDGETVTLNTDRSLTIDDRNDRNGTIATTLRSNGDGGVDVSTTAHDVDLGGYLVDKSDGDRDPVAAARGYGGRTIPSAGNEASRELSSVVLPYDRDVTSDTNDLEAA